MEQDQTSLQDVPHAIPAAESDVGDDPRRPEASQAACEGCGDPPLDAWTSTSTSGQLCPWTLRAAVRLVHDHVFGAVRLRAPGALASFATSTRLLSKGGLRRQVVEDEAEDADVRGAV